ncbi:hypothetical protein IWX48DRAFT_629491 [Phyllosticta citricarpa]
MIIGMVLLLLLCHDTAAFVVLPLLVCLSARLLLCLHTSLTRSFILGGERCRQVSRSLLYSPPPRCSALLLPRSVLLAVPRFPSLACCVAMFRVALPLSEGGVKQC